MNRKQSLFDNRWSYLKSAQLCYWHCL